MGNPFFWTKYLIRDVTVKSKFEFWKVRQLKILIEDGEWGGLIRTGLWNWSLGVVSWAR